MWSWCIHLISSMPPPPPSLNYSSHLCTSRLDLPFECIKTHSHCNHCKFRLDKSYCVCSVYVFAFSPILVFCAIRLKGLILHIYEGKCAKSTVERWISGVFFWAISSSHMFLHMKPFGKSGPLCHLGLIIENVLFSALPRAKILTKSRQLSHHTNSLYWLTISILFSLGRSVQDHQPSWDFYLPSASCHMFCI